MRILRLAGIVLGSILLLYAGLTAALYGIMRQPPDRFGAVMRHVPGVAMGVLPFVPLWMSARAGTLQPGDMAPDFELSTVDHTRRVRLSDECRDKPVVLIFGSYT
jgi:hypothetical protein